MAATRPRPSRKARRVVAPGREGDSETFVYAWPRPAVTADVAVFRVAALRQPGPVPARSPKSPRSKRPALEVLLIQRGRPPFEGCWALPGGFVEKDEDLPLAAARELLEETGVRVPRLEQVGVVGTPGRDPRGHTVTAIYVATTTAEAGCAAAGDDANAAEWFPVARLPSLAFDHRDLVNWCSLRIRDRLGRSLLLFDLVPPRFAREALRDAWSAAGGDAAGFARHWHRLRRQGAVVRADSARGAQAGRPMYRVDRRVLARFDPLAGHARR